MPEIFTTSKTTNKLNFNNTYQQAPVKQNAVLRPDLKKVAPGIFSALVSNSVGFSFAHQEKDEQILLFMRRHFITNFLWITITFIALLLPPLFPIFMHMLNLPPFSLPLTLSIILVFFYYLLIIGFAFYNFVDWFYNIGILTQKRIIDIDFMHLSYIDIAITQLPEIEDVVHRQKGFLSSYFNYGDVISHTVSGREDFVLESVPHPTQVVDTISKLITD